VLRTYSPPPEQVTFEGAGHFYHGRLGDVREAVLPFIERHWPPA
jgi:alpha/beta superfamily hydrolase